MIPRSNGNPTQSYTKSTKTFILFILSLVLGLVGCCYAPSIYWAIKGDPGNSEKVWRELPPPPEEAKEIIAVDYWTVYIKTTNGKIFSCYRESNLDIDCWKEVKTLPDLTEDWDCEGCLFALPPPYIEVLQNFQIDYRAGRDSRSAFSYVLDKNGTIWQWGFERFAIIGSARVWRITQTASIIGCCVGNIIPVIVIFYFWRRELRNLFKRKKDNKNLKES